MTRITLGILTCVMAAALVVHAQVSPEALLKGAMQREQIDGDAAGAIAQYKAIVDTYPANHAVAAQALLQLAGLYERRGQHDEARQALQRIVADHATGGAAVVTARTRLTKMQEATAEPFKMTSLDAWLKDADRIAPSPDGRYLAYLRGSTYYIREFATAREQPLVEFRNGESAFGALVWAPDSKHAAFGVSAPNIAGVDRRIVTIGTREVRSVGPSGARLGASFRWSPDGRRLAMLRKTGSTPFEIHVVAVETLEDLNAGPTKVPDGAPGFPGVAWSPDSNRVAFLASGAGDEELIRIVTMTTKAATDLAIGAGPSASGARTTIDAWTAAGDIYYGRPTNAGNDFFLVGVSGAAPRKVCEGRGAARGDTCGGLSPDGALVITRQMEIGDGRVVLRSTAGGQERFLTPEAVFEQPAPGFSRDGRLYAFRSNRDGGWGLYVAPVDQTPVANPVRVAMLASESTNVTGTWTATGFVARFLEDQTNVYRIDLDPVTRKPTAPTRLTQDSPVNQHPFVATDGRRIGYVSRGRAAGLAVMDSNGTRERVVKELAPAQLSRMNVLGWRSLEEVVVSDARVNTGQVFQAPKYVGILNVATGDLKFQTAPIDTPGLTLVPGPRLLFYPSRSADGHLAVRPLDGGPERAIAMPDDWLEYVVSPDAKFVAYSITKWATDPKKPSPSEIRLKSVDTGTERVLVNYADGTDGDPGPLVFSPDGKFLAYRDVAAQMFILNLESGASVPLVTTPQAGVSFDYSEVDWSADGSFIVLTGKSSRSSWRAYTGVTYDAVTKLIGAKK